MSLMLVRVHELEQVREIIQTACEIADAYGHDFSLRVQVFEQACALLAARVPVAQQPVPLDLSAIRGNGAGL